ncbi:MAG: SGNH/GDSL hydrolase family protein [Candidatus Hydrogenedentes bacterium]|nr:SGNH/GDSL hydrolase family protein [Candidatus Hydrogenedentota bacterium]
MSSVRGSYVGVRVEAEVTNLDPPLLVWGPRQNEFVPMDPIPADSPDAPVAHYEFVLTKVGETEPSAANASVTIFGIPRPMAGEQTPPGSWRVTKEAISSTPVNRTATYRWEHWGPEGLSLAFATGPDGGTVIVKTAQGEQRINTHSEKNGRINIPIAPNRIRRAFSARVPRPALVSLHLRFPNAERLKLLHVESWRPFVAKGSEPNVSESPPLTPLFTRADFEKENNGAPSGWWVSNREHVVRSADAVSNSAITWTLAPNDKDATRLVKTIDADLSGETMEVVAKVKASAIDTFTVAITGKSEGKEFSFASTNTASGEWETVRRVVQLPKVVDTSTLNARLMLSPHATAPVHVTAVEINHGYIASPITWTLPDTADQLSSAIATETLQRDAQTGDIVLPDPSILELGGTGTAVIGFLLALVVLGLLHIVTRTIQAGWRRFPESRWKHRTASAIANLALILTSCVVGIGLIEASLRLIYFGTLSGIDVRSNISVQAHPTRGWMMRPNNRARTQYLDYDVLVTTNSKGLRDGEHAYEHPKGVYRIALLGDSFMEAYQVDMAFALPQLLEVALESRNVEVINFGVRGYGTAQEYLMLLEEGLRYTPDLVLLAYYPLNDLVDNSYELTQLAWGDDVWRTASRPYPAIDTDGTISVALRDPLKARRAIELDVAQSLRWKEILANRGFIMNTATHETFRFLQQAYSLDNSIQFDPNVEYGSLLTSYSPGVPQHPEMTADQYAALWNDAWDITARCIREIRLVAAQNGAKFAAFSIPAKIQVDERLQASLLSQFPGLQLNIEKPQAQLAALAEAEGFAKLDLFPVIKASCGTDGSVLYHRYRDTHWNSKGHAVAAKALIEFLKSHELIPSNVQ